MPLGEVFAIASEYERAGRLEDAERLVGRILEAHPRQADALHLGGIVAHRRKRPAEALERLEQAIRYGVDTPLYLRNLCEVYRTVGRLDDAERAARRAVAMAPGDPLSLHNLSVILYHRLDLDGSFAAASQALALAPRLPGAHLALAEALLLQGRMERGWEEYEWRFRVAGVPAPMPASDKPQWDGRALEGRLLVVADQGFGDAIQFMRYLPWVAERCARVAIGSSPEVAGLLRQVAPWADVFVRWPDCPDHAAHVTLSGLPRLHRTRVESVPWTGPYVVADADRVRSWGTRLDALLPTGHKRVALAWAGRPTHSNDRGRSVRLAAFRPLGDLPGIAFVAIQKGPAAAEAADWFGRAPLVALGPEITCFEDTAAILANLDLLLCVDTSVGHLAGAMGCPAWVMLPRAPDWRWLLGRDDSPWYPSHTLVRQETDGDWTGVMRRIAARLPAALATRQP